MPLTVRIAEISSGEWSTITYSMGGVEFIHWQLRRGTLISSSSVRRTDCPLHLQRAVVVIEAARYVCRKAFIFCSCTFWHCNFPDGWAVPRQRYINGRFIGLARKFVGLTRTLRPLSRKFYVGQKVQKFGLLGALVSKQRIGHLKETSQAPMIVLWSLQIWISSVHFEN